MRIPSFFLFFAALPCHADAPSGTAVLAALKKTDGAIEAGQFAAISAELNSDGKPDALVLMGAGSGYTGSGGTTLFVLLGDDGGFTSMGSISTVNEPIFLREKMTSGMRDLLATARGGGAAPGLAPLVFDGKAYPAAPGESRVPILESDQAVFTPAGQPFEESGSLHGITFKVTSPNTGAGNFATITPSGLDGDNAPIHEPIAGIVRRIETADINADGSPEIYVFIHDGAREGLVAWSGNARKSLSRIAIEGLGGHAKGYAGGDEFAVVETSIGRRFPVGTPDQPRTRQIQYKLHRGEAGWSLKIAGVSEF